MAAFTQMRFLDSVRLTKIIGTLAAELEVKRPLNFLARLPVVACFDDELFGRFTGKVLAADLIADDQKAVVQESMTLEIDTHVLPNVKIGQRLGQKLLNRLHAIENGGMTVQGQNALRDWDVALAANLLLAVRQRLNAMSAAMMLDSFSYDRFGVKISNASWGMPSNLKVTTGTAWSNTAATPISDIFGVDQVARLAYGIEYDLITMTTPDFRNMTATTEFANKAWSVLGAAFLTTSAALPTKDDPELLGIAQRVLKKTIVLDDTQFYTRSNDGTLTQTRVLPATKVLLSRSQDDGDGSTWDLGSASVTESIVRDLIGTGPDGIGGEQAGPVGYYTPAAPDLNPPGVVAWAVARAFPRKFVPEATAVLTVA